MIDTIKQRPPKDDFEAKSKVVLDEWKWEVVVIGIKYKEDSRKILISAYDGNGWL